MKTTERHEEHREAQNIFSVCLKASKVIKQNLDNGSFDKEEFLIASRSPYLTHVHFAGIWKDSE